MSRGRSLSVPSRPLWHERECVATAAATATTAATAVRAATAIHAATTATVHAATAIYAATTIYAAATPTTATWWQRKARRHGIGSHDGRRLYEWRPRHDGGGTRLHGTICRHGAYCRGRLPGCAETEVCRDG